MRTRKAENKYCKGYCGITCVNGNCPNALSNYDAERDDDAYANYHLDKPMKCAECGYYNGCSDCCFFETNMCIGAEGKNA